MQILVIEHNHLKIDGKPITGKMIKFEDVKMIECLLLLLLKMR